VKILSIVNQKGGVGKTTSTINLAAYLAMGKRKVLVIDLDPQGNASSGLGIRESEAGIYEVLSGDAQIETTIVPTEQKNLSLLTSSSDLAGASVELNEHPHRLKEVLEDLRGYDIVLIDAPPSLGALTVNALVASDGLIVPLQAEYYALEGVAGLLETIDRVKDALNKKLKTLGIVITMFDGRTNLAQQVEENVRRHFGEQVFWSVIPRNVKLSEAPSYGKTINQYAPMSNGAGAYRRLAEEVMQRAQKL
jgi:chromosome partitioning protein